MRHKFWKDWKVPSKSQKVFGCSKVCGLHESLISCSLEAVYCIQARYHIWSQHGSQQQLPHVFPSFRNVLLAEDMPIHRGRTQWKQLTVLALEWGAVRDKGQTDEQGWKMMKVNECPANAFWIPGKYGTCFSPVALPHGLWFAKLCMNFVSGQPPSDILLAWLAVAKQTGAMRQKRWDPEVTHCFVGEKKVVDYASTHSTPMYKGGKTSWSSFFHVIPCAGTPQTSCIDTFALLYKGACSSKVKHPSIPTLVSLQYLNLKAMQGFTSLYIGNPYLLPALRKAKSDRTASKKLDFAHDRPTVTTVPLF